MPLLNYGVLKGQVSSVEIEPEDTQSPHVQIILDAGGNRVVASVNVKSRAGATERDKWLLFHVSADFHHPITEFLATVKNGFTRLPLPAPGLPGMDYLRQNLVRREKMRPLPPESLDGSEDLNEALSFYLNQAKQHKADCYAFGDAMRDYRSGEIVGVHDVHYNQGSDAQGPYAHTNGVYQDGGLLLHHKNTNRWVALLLAFQNQVWHTDDASGHPLALTPEHGHVPDGAVRIVAARFDHRNPTITLLNASPERIVLTGWELDNGFKGERNHLHGTLHPGEAQVFSLIPYYTYSSGWFTLLDQNGRKVDGVSCTGSQITHEGITVF